MADPLRALRLPVVPVEPREEFAASLLRRLEHRAGQFTPGAATARYFVTDLDAAVGFYTRQLGFAEELRAAPAFAMLYRGDLRLLLSVPGQPGAGGTAAGESEAGEPAAREPGAVSAWRVKPDRAGRNGSGGDRRSAAGQRCPVPHRDHDRDCRPPGPA